MGFSIGRLIGAIAPIAGGLIAGPAGAAVGSAVAAGFAPSPPSRAPTPIALGRVPTGRVLREGGAAIAGLLAGGISMNGNGRTLKEILAEAREFRPGATRNKIIAAAKACGIDIAADTFGLGTNDICAIVVLGRTRRRRGVSGANIRTTKRVLRFASGLRKDLKAIK